MSKNILIIGMGESGLAMLRYAKHMAMADCTSIYDSREQPSQLPTIQEKFPQAQCFWGTFKADMLDDVKEIWVSPGLSPHHSILKEIVHLAQASNIPVIGEIDVFWHALQHLKSAREYRPKIIAITGTNGKTTVTSLTTHLCNKSKSTAVAAGNISPSMLDALLNQLEADVLPEIWVLELSSFQLHWVKDFSPDCATVLNISEDHLDWHLDFDEYITDKLKIISPSCQYVCNRDDPYLKDIVIASSKPTIYFGQTLPLAQNQMGLIQQSNMYWLGTTLTSDALQVPTLAKKKNNTEMPPITQRELMPMDALLIKGKHNALNALAALALGHSVGLKLADMLKALGTYQGEAHRVQWLRTINDVDYYDDSKGTNVGATLAAINGLEKDLVLVAGGDGKGQSFTPLLDCVSKYVKHMVLIGKDAKRMSEELSSANVPITLFETLEDATAFACKIAQPRQAVLLSPACASLDMFKNYAHRAQVFTEVVQAFALDQGQI